MFSSFVDYAVSGFKGIEAKEWLLLALPLCFTGIGFLAAKALAGFRNYRLARQFRLSGRFITIYTNPDERGHQESAYAESTIKQRGLELTIETVENDGRTWKQRGYIVQSRFISGWYEAKDPHDTGVGTFFLEIKNSDTLIGTWGGFDHEGKRIVSLARYEFYRKYTPQIGELTSAHITRILLIADQSFGAGYVTASALDRAGSKCFVASVDDELAGFCIIRKMDANALQLIVPSGQHIGEALRYADKTGTVGVIKTIAVENAYRRSGIGRELFRKAEQRLFDDGIRAIVVPIWYANKVGNLENIAKLHQYQLLYEHPQYWNDECTADHFRCIAKTGDECVCSCRFYVKTYDRHRDGSNRTYNEIMRLFAGQSM